MSDAAERWERIRELYAAGRQLPEAAREAWLQAQDVAADVRDELRSLLAHADDANGERDFLAAPRQAWAEIDDAADAHGRIGQRLGDWKITARLGVGGMGEVYEARRADGSFEGVAAVKLLKRGMDSAAVLQRFAQERQALARLSHPHIARLLDAGASDDGLPYFVLEYVEGRPIDEAVRGLALEARLKLFLQLADAVAYAHRNLLVHRDLKPGNVMVDADGQVKLLDFGIAKALDPFEQGSDGQTTVGSMRPYTPNYASPEQVRGEPVGTATDIYSLGVLLYQLLTGVRPTGRHATTPAEAARSVLEDAPTRPSRLSAAETVDPQWPQTRRKLDGDLDNILLKALEKPAERRYASVDALAADVQAFLSGHPVSARAPRPAYVLGKFVHRNRWAVLAGALGGVGLASGLAAALLQERTAAALGVVGLAAGLVLALVQGRQAAQARDDARRQLAGVKHITTELVFRYGDAISQLPGGASAQEAMLKQTIASLDVTLAAAPDDADLIMLVASALGRLAQIQGNPTFAGPERAAEAAATVARALALGGRAWAARRHEWQFVSQHLITLLTRANMLRNQGQPAEGLDVLVLAQQRCAEALTERLSEVGRANLLELSANIATNLAHFNDHSGRPSLGRPEEALRWYGEAEQAFRALYGDATMLAAMNRHTDPGSPAAEEWANHNLANVYVGRALVHQRLGDPAAMKREVEAAILLRQDNLRRAPSSAIWRQSLMFDQNYLAIALLRLGEAAPALAAAQSAWDIAAERLREEGPDSPWLATRGNLAPQYGRALAACGRHKEALPVLDIALQRIAKALAEGDTPALREQQVALQADRARAEQAQVQVP